MPTATDVRNTIADRLWTLFEAQSTITTAVLPGARNKGIDAGWLRQAINKMPVADRQLEVSFYGPGRHSLHTKRLGFAIEDDELPEACDFDVERQFTVVITYRQKLPTDPGVHPVQEAIEQTLLLAGPTLGLGIVPPDGLGEMSFEERPTQGDEYPQPGRATVWRLPITTKQSGLTLATETP